MTLAADKHRCHGKAAVAPFNTCPERATCERYLQIARDRAKPLDRPAPHFQIARVGRNACHYRIPMGGC